MQARSDKQATHGWTIGIACACGWHCNEWPSRQAALLCNNGKFWAFQSPTHLPPLKLNQPTITQPTHSKFKTPHPPHHTQPTPSKATSKPNPSELAAPTPHQNGTPQTKQPLTANQPKQRTLCLKRTNKPHTLSKPRQQQLHDRHQPLTPCTCSNIALPIAHCPLSTSQHTHTRMHVAGH